MFLYMKFGIDCNATCMNEWINTHRVEPTDFALWKTRLCELLNRTSCQRSMTITLADNTDIDAVLNLDLHENDNHHVVLVGNLSSFQNKHHQITYPVFVKDIENLNDALKKSKYLLCNGKEEKQGNQMNKIVLERSTIFQANGSFNDYSIHKKTNGINIKLLASPNSSCSSVLLKEALIFMAIVNFKNDTYNFTNKNCMYKSNISVIQNFDKNKIYVTEDGQSIIWYWMWGIIILLIIIFVRIWYFTGKIFEAKSFYRYTCSNFPRYYVCNPLLISARTPLTDILRTYFIERAWFRKILFIGSSYCTTFFMTMFVCSLTGMTDSSLADLISVLFTVVILILLMIECYAEYINQHMKYLPEPSEALEFNCLISPMLTCLIHSVVKISSFLYNKDLPFPSINMRILILIVSFVSSLNFLFFLNPLVAVISLEVFIITLFEIENGVIRLILIVLHVGGIEYIVNACLLYLLKLYLQYAEWMFSHQEWAPLIFLCISYLVDVSNEYTAAFKKCLRSVVNLITLNRSMECIDYGKVAILAANETESYIAYTMRDEQGTINSKALLFYDHGVPHVTSKFYYEVRKLIDEVLGSSLSIRKEMESIFFRMFPIIITILVINTSNLSLDKFEGVNIQKYLVTYILFQLFSKFLLKREPPKIDIDSNPYFKSKLHELSSHHKEVFQTTDISKNKENLPAMPNAMIIVTWVTVVLIFIFTQMQGHTLHIKGTMLHSENLKGLIFIMYYLFFGFLLFL